jgi:flavin reductase (DIM6/NTAB) family NADH-FMN oxidoreductase RutF
MTIDPDSFRSVLGRFASGITVVTTRDSDQRDLGMTVSAFCSVSLRPPLVQVCVDHEASLHAALLQNQRYAVSILAADQEALSRRFSTADSTRRFDGIGYRRGESGMVLLDDALAHLECRIVASHTAGDHTLFVGEVLAAERGRSAPPLLYLGQRYVSMDA